MAEETKKKKPNRQELEAEVAELRDKLLRIQADFENFRRRTLKETDDIVRYANTKILLEVCDVYDNFERAMYTADEIDMTKSAGSDEKVFKSFVKGIKLIYQQIDAFLKKNDCIKLDVIGKDFDPHYHDALSTIPSTEPENKIVAVIQNGYMYKDKVIRHSQVVVSNGEKPEE